MTNSHADLVIPLEAGSWPPMFPPQRGEDRSAFHAFMLLPGFSVAFHAATLGRSRSSIIAYRRAANNAAERNPQISLAARNAIGSIRAEHGLQMAQSRKAAQLPHWSREAIFEFRKRGHSRDAIARIFRCSRSTVANVLQGKGTGYELFSGRRRLAECQRSPPGCWRE